MSVREYSCIVTGINEQIHLKNFDAVFQRLKSYGLRVNKNKCELFQNRIEYPGHKIDAQGLHKTASKVGASICVKLGEGPSRGSASSRILLNRTCNFMVI